MGDDTSNRRVSAKDRKPCEGGVRSLIRPTTGPRFRSRRVARFAEPCRALASPTSSRPSSAPRDNAFGPRVSGVRRPTIKSSPWRSVGLLNSGNTPSLMDLSTFAGCRYRSWRRLVNPLTTMDFAPTRPDDFPIRTAVEAGGIESSPIHRVRRDSLVVIDLISWLSLGSHTPALGGFLGWLVWRRPCLGAALPLGPMRLG